MFEFKLCNKNESGFKICQNFDFSAIPELDFCLSRFFRELMELKTYANYSTCDRSNLADWLGNVDPKFRQYTYNLVTCGIDRNFLHRVTEQQLQEDCQVEVGFHRVRILSAARGK